MWPLLERVATNVNMDTLNNKENITSNAQRQQHGSNLKSYAGAATMDIFPSKDQAIIIEAHEGLTIKDYVSKLSTFINPSDIRFVSRIANNRICVFLSSKKIANYLTDNHQTFTINDIEVSVRPLLSKHVRVIISNVCPVIPHEVIKNALQQSNIQISSNITFIRAGLPEPGMSHIMSFRRQVFVHPDEVHKLPQSLLIPYEDTTYRLFFTTDNITCFKCKNEGHIASKCPINSISLSPIINRATDNNNENILLEIPPTEQTDDNPSGSTAMDYTNFPPIKRSLPSESSSTPENISTSDVKCKDKGCKPSKKKRAKNEKEEPASQDNLVNKSIEDLLLPTKTYIDSNQDKLPLSYTQFKSFLENSFGAPDPIPIMKDYSTDFNATIGMLKETYKLLNERSIKGRFTRVIKKLEKSIPSRESSDSEFSLDST